MRNRPDSRPRLAGLNGGTAERPGPAGAPDRSEDRQPEDQSADRWSGGTDDDEAPVGGWTPAADDPDPADDDRPGKSRERRGGAKPRHGRRTGHRPSSRLARRWVPESLRESRVDPGKRGALLLTVVAAVAALVAAVGVWWDRPEPRPVQSVSLAQLSGSAVTGTAVTGTAAPGSARNAAGLQLATLSGPATGRQSLASTHPSSTSAVRPAIIVVSVTGAVHRPGLVRLPSGARVADAIEKAGGATDQADLTGLNLAQKLTDGASVVVSDGSGSASGSGSGVSGGDARSAESTAAALGSTAGAAGGKVDLNTADVAALDALPGVGPVTAASIVSWREKNGRFTSVEQLQEIAGIGPAKYASLSPLVTV